LFEAARRSRACAYLADDDHGPLALQEILLAGCPVVGVRTGAPFIQDGVTGVLVDRLPPGARAMANDTDEKSIVTYSNAINYATKMNRVCVRSSAIEQFGTTLIVGRLLETLEVIRVNVVGNR
jgi:hypothetical protein